MKHFQSIEESQIMDQTPNLKLPYIMASQTQKHVTHNEAIRAIDTIAQLSVHERNLTVPPRSPAYGDRYIVAAGATGAWAGRDNQVAAWQGNAWMFYDPQEGWLAWVVGENQLFAWSGTAWVQVSDSDLQNIPTLGVNTTADANNRLSVASPATLLTHEGNGHQIKVNKNATADTASLLFQTNWSGRAEMGTAGNDDFSIKVSPDGAAWQEAMVIDKDTGHVGFGTDAPQARLHCVVGSLGKAVMLAGLGDLAQGPVIMLNHNAPGNRQICFVDNENGAGIRMTGSGIDALNYLTGERRTLTLGSVTHGVNIRTGLHVTGPVTMTGSVRPASYTVATLPGVGGAGSTIYVSDEVGGGVLAFSDGTNWRRMTDRAVVS